MLSSEEITEALGLAIDPKPEVQEPLGSEVPYVARELIEKATLFAERHAVYGDNYKRFGVIMAWLMQGQVLDANSPRDMNRLGILTQVVSKLTRYTNNFNKGGHNDSLDDLVVYAMMLKELDNDPA